LKISCFLKKKILKKNEFLFIISLDKLKKYYKSIIVIKLVSLQYCKAFQKLKIKIDWHGQDGEKLYKI